MNAHRKIVADEPHPLHAYTDSETGINVERLFYAGGATIAGEDHYWFALDPDYPRAQGVGRSGATAEEAISRVLAKPYRRAA